MYIKEQENLTDKGMVTFLNNNHYVQYFIELKEFRAKLLFDAYMMFHFRKHFGPEAIYRVNEVLFERMHPREGPGSILQ